MAKLPVLTEQGDTYCLFYFGRDGLTKKIGLATSTDHLTWRKHPSNPIL